MIGKSVDRVDGVEKVTGAAAYGADIRLPGMLHGKVLRSPHPHARIKSIDCSKALVLPGVLAVMTAADIPDSTDTSSAALGETAIDHNFFLQLLMAREKVFFKGHPVAALAATTPHIADEALDLIEVDYEVLPIIEDVLAALEPGAPLLHDTLFTRRPGGKRDEAPSNLGAYILQERGSLETAWAECDVVVERSFRTSAVHQGYIEPQACAAAVDAGGQVTLWTSSQGSFSTRDQVASALQLPPGQIRTIPMEVGGGFGGKTYAYLEPLAVLLARKSGRPVKLVMSRAEVFQGTGPTPGSFMRVKLGARRDGTLHAAKAEYYYDAGAFPGSAVGAACYTGLSPYKIPNFTIEGFDVVTNKPRVTAYRAPGATQAAFAVETLLDEIAVQLDIDPIDLRLQNASREGDRMTFGAPFNRIGFVETLEAAKNSPHWRSPRPAGPHAGRGVAAGLWGNWHGASTCHLTFNPDGSPSLTLGAVDLTGTRTTMAQIAAEELGLPFERVKVVMGDTDQVGFNDSTGGSRVTYSQGAAVCRAARNAMEELKRRAATLMEVDAASVEYALGTFRSGEKTLTLAQVCGKQLQTGGAIVATGVVNGLKSCPAFGVHIADVAVDPETGKVQVLRYTAVQDVGKAIHPGYVQGQMQGGAAQGIGWALTEEYVYEQGVMKNPNLLDYRALTALDIPPIETILVEVPASDGPYGVRGVGEVPIVPPPPALASAIHQAIGVRLTELPMTPERVWRALAGHAPAAD